MEPFPAPTIPLWLAGKLPFDRYAVEVEGRRMHVMETGRGLPVVMVHGNPTWGFLWRKVAAELRDDPVRVILPDLIGLGLSDKPRDPAAHTLANHARWLAGLFDALGLERFVLVVQDWGGPIALRALADHPERLAGLVVLNTVLGPPRPGFRPTSFHRFARVPVLSDLVFRGFGYPQRALWLAQGDRASIRGEDSRAYQFPLAGLSRNVAPLALARMVPDSLAHPSVPDLERVQRVVEGFRGPSAIVWGDRDPVLGRAFNRVHKLLPDAAVTRTQAGHFLQEQVPGPIAAAVRSVARAVASGDAVTPPAPPAPRAPA